MVGTALFAHRWGIPWPLARWGRVGGTRGKQDCGRLHSVSTLTTAAQTQQQNKSQIHDMSRFLEKMGRPESTHEDPEVWRQRCMRGRKEGTGTCRNHEPASMFWIGLCRPYFHTVRDGISVLRNGGITATHLTDLQKWVGDRRKTGFGARTLWKGPGRTTKPGPFESKRSGEEWEVRQLLNGKHGSGRWEGSGDRLWGFAQGSHHRDPWEHEGDWQAWRWLPYVKLVVIQLRLTRY